MRLLQALVGIRIRSSKPETFSSLEHRHRFLSTSRKRAHLSARAGLCQPQKRSKGEAPVSSGKYGGGGGIAEEKLRLGVLQTFGASTGGDDLRHGLTCDVVSTGKQIVDALHRGDREKASSLLGDESLKASDFPDVLRHCADLPDPVLAWQTWNIMAGKGIIPDRFCYLCVTQALCKGGYLEKAFNFLKYPGEGYTSYTSPAAYNTFLKASLEKHSPVHIKQCLELIELMDQRMVGKSEVTYAHLLKIAVRLKKLSAVNQMWEEYIKHFSPSIMSLKNFVAAFARLGDVKSAYQKLQQMVDLAIQENVNVDNMSGYRRMGSPSLDIPVPVIGPSHVENFDREDNRKAPFQFVTSELSSSAVGELAKNLEISVRRLLRWSFRDVIYSCAESKIFGLAERLMHQMQYLGLHPTRYVYHAFIKAVIREKGIGEAMKVLKEMEQRNIKPFNSTLAAISMACSDALDLESAERLLDQMSSSTSPYPYNQFLGACDKLVQPRRAIRMLSKMRQLKIQPNVRTFELLFSLFGNDVDGPYDAGSSLSKSECMKRINAIEMDMARNNVPHNHWSLMYLLKALAAKGMLGEFMHYLQLAEDTFHRIKCKSEGTLVYTAIMHSLIEADYNNHNKLFRLEQYKLTIELFKKMRANEFQPALDTYCIMIDGCSLIRCYKTARAVVSLILRDGYFVHDVVYGALVKVALKCGDLSEGLRLLDQMASDKIHSIVVYNSIIGKALKKRMFDLVEILVEQMHRNKIKPDLSTCSLVFTSYMRQEVFSTAVEVVQVLSQRSIYLEENFSVEEVESYALEEDSDVEAVQDSDVEMQRLEELFARSENATFALLILRTGAGFGLSIPWPPNQSIWARSTSAAYDTWLTSTNGSWSKWLGTSIRFKRSRPRTLRTKQNRGRDLLRDRLSRRG